MDINVENLKEISVQQFTMKSEYEEREIIRISKSNYIYYLGGAWFRVTKGKNIQTYDQYFENLEKPEEQYIQYDGIIYKTPDEGKTFYKLPENILVTQLLLFHILTVIFLEKYETQEDITVEVKGTIPISTVTIREPRCVSTGNKEQDKINNDIYNNINNLVRTILELEKRIEKVEPDKNRDVSISSSIFGLNEELDLLKKRVDSLYNSRLPI